MTKKEFVNAVAEKAKITKKSALTLTNTVLEVLEESLKKGEEVRIPGFGTFKVLLRKERKARHPRTKQEITIPAKKVVKFVPGSQLKLKIS